MRKNVLPFLIFISLLIVILCLCLDFNTYDPRSRSIPCGDNGILFTLTTFDGKTESEPLVPCFGHTWVSVDNRSGHSVYLKDLEIKDDEVLTFSIWANSGHRGVFFNLESNFIGQYDRYEGRQSLSVSIDESELETIGDYIENNDDWTLLKNCSRWAIQLWNQVVEENYRLKTPFLVCTPKRLQKAMGEFDCVEIDRDFSGSGGVFFWQDGIRRECRLCPSNTK